MMQLPSPRHASRASEAHPQDARTTVSPPSKTEYVGVGIVFDEQLRVLNLVKGGAAERNGSILRYDLLLAVDGRSMAAASTEQLKIAVRGPPGALTLARCQVAAAHCFATGTSVVLTFARKDHPAPFDVQLLRSGLAPPPPAAPVQAFDPPSPVPAPGPDLSATSASNSNVIQSLYAAIDDARLDIAQKEEEVSALARQLQSAAFHSDRERSAAASADARRMNVVEVVQQLDEEAQVPASPKKKENVVTRWRRCCCSRKKECRASCLSSNSRPNRAVSKSKRCVTVCGRRRKRPFKPSQSLTR
jgi:hypothetical protein